jgi:hypothetical protein
MGQELAILRDLNRADRPRVAPGFHQGPPAQSWPLGGARPSITHGPPLPPHDEAWHKLLHRSRDLVVFISNLSVENRPLHALGFATEPTFWLKRRWLDLSEICLVSAGHAKTEAQDDPRLPYVSLIRGLIAKEQIAAARSLLTVALRRTQLDSHLEALQRVLAPAKLTPRAQLDVDRTREYRWLATNRPAYRGKWVALDGDTLVAQAGSFKELQTALKALELARPPLVHRMA